MWPELNDRRAKVDKGRIPSTVTGNVEGGASTS